MSSLKSKLANAIPGSSSSANATAQEQSQYRLLVTAGPSYDQSTHKTVHVNSEDQPTYIENSFLRAKIHVRIRNFSGLPSSSPATSSYLEDASHVKDQYSVGFSFVPKVDLPALHTVWGNDLDHPIRDRLPPGFNTAFRIVKEFIDPGLACDVYADEPWLYGPSLSCWFALRIGDSIGDQEDFAAPGILSEGADGSGVTVRERLGLPENNEKRRKHFLQAANREKFVFEKGRVYYTDFFNPYLDFANYALKLPGFSLKVIKYIGDKTHCLRYVFKNRETGDVYLNVNITLLWGEKLEAALKNDEDAQQVGGDGKGDLVGIAAGANGGGGERANHEVKDDANQGVHERDGPGSALHAGGSGAQESTPTTANPPQDSSSGGGAPETMQLHPGDQNAAASEPAATISTQQKEEDDGVDEIDRLLRETSTKQAPR